MSNRLGGFRNQAYRGTNADQPPNMHFEDRAPTSYDTQASIGDFWIDSSAALSNRLYYLASLQGTSATNGESATWIPLGTGAGAGVNTLTGNDAIVVPPTANNINVVGDGVTANVTGNAGTSTLTITASGSVPIQFDADPGFGSATPVLGILNIIGAGGTTTSAAGNTITITSSAMGSGILTLTGDSGGAVGPDGANNVNIVGGSDIIAVGDPGTNTLTIDSAGFLANQFDTDSGSAVPVGGILEILTQNATLGAGATVLFSAPGSTNIVQLDVTDGDANTLLGMEAGNLTLSGTFNTGHGYQVFSDLTSGSNNSAFSAQSGNSLTSGSDNTLLGFQAGGSITTGDSNIIIGSQSGSAYMGAESNNILIDNAGVLSESDTIRIGTNGTQTSAYMQGVYNTTGLSGTRNVVVDASGQLGTGSGGGGGGLSNAFFAIQAVSSGGVTGASTTYTLGTAGGAPFTELYDDGGVLFPGDGAGMPVLFTAPDDGIYWLCVRPYLVRNPVNNTIMLQPIISLITTSRTYTNRGTPNGATTNSSLNSTFSINQFEFGVQAQMTAGDTAYWDITVTSAVAGSYFLSPDFTWVCGYRIS
jgi:hypothetical protein